MHFRTQILNTTGKIGGNCQGGAKKGGFNNEEKRGHSGGKTLRKSQEWEGTGAIKESLIVWKRSSIFDGQINGFNSDG